MTRGPLGTTSLGYFLFSVLFLKIINCSYCSDIIVSKYDSSVVFSTLMIVQWLGAFLIAVNAKLLKVNM